MARRLHRSPCVWLYSLFFIVIIWSTFQMVAAWLNRSKEYRGFANQRYHEVAHLSNLVKQRPLLEKRLTNFSNQLGKAGYFLDAPSPSQASADLIERLRLSLSGQKARLLDFKFLAPERKENMLRIGVRAHIQGDESTLLQLLYRNEQQRPLLFVESLAVRALNPGRSGMLSGAAAGLDINVVLCGYMLRE